MLALLLALLAAAPSAASAQPPRQRLVAEDQRGVLDGPDERTAATLDDMRLHGVDTIRLTLAWRDLAPAAADDMATGPRALSPFLRARQVDRALRMAHARGMRVIVALSFNQPSWAGRPADPGRPDRINTAIDLAAWGRFVARVAERWGGGWTDPDRPPDGPVPAMDYLEPFNEPNFPAFLQPQLDRAGRAVSPNVYRRLYDLAAGALRGRAPRTRLLFGSLARADLAAERKGSNGKVTPVRFLSELLCVDADGRRRRDGHCRRRRPPLPAAGLSYHPYPLQDPAWRPAGPQDAGIRELGALRRMLRGARRAGTLADAGGDATGVWITEFGYETGPRRDGRTLTEAAAAARWAQAWAQAQAPGVRSFSQFVWADAPDSADPVLDFQTGVRRADGTPKATLGALTFPAAPRYDADGRPGTWVALYRPDPAAPLRLTCAGRGLPVRRAPDGTWHFRPRGRDCRLVVGAPRERRATARTGGVALRTYPARVPRDAVSRR